MKSKLRLSGIAFTCIILFALSCKSNQNKVSDKVIEEGRVLSTQYCQSCHMLPDPKWVDAETWETGVMPAMGPKLGIFYFRDKQYNSNRYDFSLPQNFYPAKPMLTDEQWQKIMKLLCFSMAAEKNETKQVRKYPIKNDLELFTPLIPNKHLAVPATSYVKIDENSKAFPFVISDAIKHTIYRYDNNLKIGDSLVTRGPIVNIEMNQNKLVAM